MKTFSIQLLLSTAYGLHVKDLEREKRSNEDQVIKGNNSKGELVQGGEMPMQKFDQHNRLNATVHFLPHKYFV